MDLRLTITVPGRVGAVTDVVITAAPGTPLAAALPELRAIVGQLGQDDEICCNRAALDVRHPLGTPPLVQGAVLVLGASERPDPPVLEAHAVAGPDAGSTWPLRAGVNLVGRSSSSAVRPEDEDVSRRHAQIVVEPQQVTVRDGGSTNGTWYAGRRITSDQPVDADRPFRVGGTTLVVGRLPRPPAATVADGEGQVLVNRRPVVRPDRRSTAIVFPPRPDDRGPARLPWPTLVLPLLLAVPMAVFWHQPAFLAFALLSPLLVAGQYLYDRRSGRREADDRLRRWQEVSEATEKRLAEAVEEDVRRLGELRPDLAELVLAATTPTDDLWRRSPGAPAFLHLRLGLGPEVSGIAVRRPGTDPPGGDAGAEPVVHRGVAVVVDLPAVTVLGVCGPRAELLGLARSLVGQVVVLHAPTEVCLTVLVAHGLDRAGWQWAGRVPHHVPLRSGGPARRVVVLDGARQLRADPEVGAVLRAATTGRDGPGAAMHTGSGAGVWPGAGSGAGAGSSAGPGAGLGAGAGAWPGAGTAAGAGVLVICLASSEQELPVECGATVVLEPDGRSGTLRRPGAEPVVFAPDLAGPRWAERISRGLAPLRAAAAGAAQLPEEVRFVDLVVASDGVDPTVPEAVARHWRRAGPRGPTTLVGVDGAGEVRVDLRRDGPHALVGGTTGAGKSELLQTMIVGLAVDSGPDEISFLLVDYKGGAAFRECLPLPHVTGLITDLDPRLAARALASLRAELRRRERLLAGVGAVDLDEFCRAGGTLPRLVVVVDEFRVLAEELPDFVTGLIRVAAVGRSLGVHLVLATQRPAGIVSPEIAANTNLRIALRLRDEGDSRDLVDDAAAARLPGDMPGRALVRVGSGVIRAVQVARVRGGPATGPGPEPLVRPAGPYAFSADAGPAERARTGGTGADMEALVNGLRGAAALAQLDPPAPPWLPPLPGSVRRDEIAGAMTIGLKDVPEEQDLRPLAWPPGGRHLAVAGGPRSGRTTAARTLAEAAAGSPARGTSANAGEDAHGGAGTQAGRNAGADGDIGTRVGKNADAHDDTGTRVGKNADANGGTGTRAGTNAGAGAYAEAGDRGRKDAGEGATAHVYVVDGSGALRDLERLRGVEAVVAVNDLERCERLVRRLRAAVLTGSQRVVLVVDGWEGLVAAWNELDHGRLVDDLTALLRDGPSAGLQVALTGGRGLLTGAVSSLLAERLVLRFADPADAVLAGVRGELMSRSMPPGRAVHLGPDDPDGHEVQLALPIGAPDGRVAAARPGWAVPALPRHLDSDEFWARAGDGHDGVPVGVGGDAATVLSLAPAPLTVVLGSPGSGRSAALRTIAEGLRRQGRRTLTTTLARPVPLADVAAALGAGITVLIDDVRPPTALGDSAADRLGDLVVEHLSRAAVPRAGLGVVLACSPADVLSGFRGLPVAARGARQGLVLGAAGPVATEVFGVRVARYPGAPPGRATLIRGGRPTPVQLPAPGTVEPVAVGVRASPAAQR